MFALPKIALPRPGGIILLATISPMAASHFLRCAGAARWRWSACRRRVRRPPLWRRDRLGAARAEDLSALRAGVLPGMGLPVCWGPNPTHAGLRAKRVTHPS